MKKIMLLVLSMQIGCATMFSGEQTIPVVTNPKGATVTVYSAKEEVVFTGTTPCSITLDKKKLVNGRVVISKKGYRDTEVFLGDVTDRWVFANVCCCLGFFVGAGIDYLNDNHRKTEVERIDLDLYSKNAFLFQENAGCVIVEDREYRQAAYEMNISQNAQSLTIQIEEL